MNGLVCEAAKQLRFTQFIISCFHLYWSTLQLNGTCCFFFKNMSKFPVSQVKSYFYIFYGKSNPLFSRLEPPQFTQFISGIYPRFIQQFPLQFPIKIPWIFPIGYSITQCFIPENANVLQWIFINLYYPLYIYIYIYPWEYHTNILQSSMGMFFFNVGQLSSNKT